MSAAVCPKCQCGKHAAVRSSFEAGKKQARGSRSLGVSRRGDAMHRPQSAAEGRADPDAGSTPCEQLGGPALLSGRSCTAQAAPPWRQICHKQGPQGMKWARQSHLRYAARLLPRTRSERKLTHLVSVKGRGCVQGMLHQVQASRRGRGLPPGGGILCSRAHHSKATSTASQLGRLQQDSQAWKHAQVPWMPHGPNSCQVTLPHAGFTHPMHEGQVASTLCQVSGHLASCADAGTASHDLCIGLSA